jgi:hypothetical protein
VINNGFQNNPVTISWAKTNYVNPAGQQMPITAFEFNCGNLCLISNETFYSSCDVFQSSCYFDQGSVAYSAIESPTIWPRYYDSSNIINSTRSHKIVKVTDTPTLMILTVTAQYNPN